MNKTKLSRFNYVRIGLVAAVLLATLFTMLAHGPKASAAGLQIAPIEYRQDINGGIKKGAVDITNMSGETRQVTIEVRAFRQIDNSGTLTFYDDPTIKQAITPDLNKFTLKPYTTEHMYFLVDGTKLPHTMIFASILAEASPEKASYNITPLLRVGTLLIINNGASDPVKEGQISQWHVPFLQVGNAVHGEFSFKNTEQGDGATGFFPKFKLSVAGNVKQIDGSLVFPGIDRKHDFAVEGSRIGLFNLKLTSDAKTSASQWILVLTGYWRWLFPLIILALAIVLYYMKRFLPTAHRKHSKK